LTLKVWTSLMMASGQKPGGEHRPAVRSRTSRRRGDVEDHAAPARFEHLLTDLSVPLAGAFGKGESNESGYRRGAGAKHFEPLGGGCEMRHHREPGLFGTSSAMSSVPPPTPPPALRPTRTLTRRSDRGLTRYPDALRGIEQSQMAHSPDITLA